MKIIYSSFTAVSLFIILCHISLQICYIAHCVAVNQVVLIALQLCKYAVTHCFALDLLLQFAWNNLEIQIKSEQLQSNLLSSQKLLYKNSTYNNYAVMNKNHLINSL